MTPFRTPYTVSLIIGCLIVIGLIFMFPAEALLSAIRGVSIWWDILFPALFPFFVISETLLGFGIVHFFGALLDPVMRPIFRIPGIGGFVMAMGFASGYPIGARLTAQLWEQRLINREEGERLVAFTTSSDPIFLIGAVSVGFFHQPGLAGVLAIAHYGAGLLVGFLMRFHGSSSIAAAPPRVKSKPQHGTIVFRAFEAMHKARILDGRPLGTLLAEAIRQSLKLVFIVGGLVVFFSVVLELFSIIHVMDLLYKLIDSVLHIIGIPMELTKSIVDGLFEVTLGAQSAGNAPNHLPLVSKVAIAAFVLSWGGLSVHAQVVSLLTATNLRYFPFLAARAIHAILAALLVFVIWHPLMH